MHAASSGHRGRYQFEDLLCRGGDGFVLEGKFTVSQLGAGTRDLRCSTYDGPASVEVLDRLVCGGSHDYERVGVWCVRVEKTDELLGL